MSAPGRDRTYGPQLRRLPQGVGDTGTGCTSPDFSVSYVHGCSPAFTLVHNLRRRIYRHAALAALILTACNPPPTTTVTYASNDPSFPVTHWYGVMWHVEDAAGLSPRDAMLAAICHPQAPVGAAVQQHTPFALQIGGSAGEWRGVAIEFERDGIVERIQVDRDCPPPPVWPTLTAEQVQACGGRGGGVE